MERTNFSGRMPWASLNYGEQKTSKQIEMKIYVLSRFEPTTFNTENWRLRLPCHADTEEGLCLKVFLDNGIWIKSTRGNT